MQTRFALLLACFFLSGFAALVYETAWTRELGFVFGTSELAVAAVLAAYMGGLALGAAAAARLAPRLRRPVLAYGLLELSIAVCALAVPTGIRLVSALYVGLLGGRSALPEGSAPGAALLQLLGAFAVLVPPTALMGATLPLLARHAVRRESEIGSRVGVLYAVNTAGAIAGTLCAAFALMPELGLRRTVYVGVGVNAVVFAAAAALARGAPPPAGAADGRASTTAGPGWVLPAVVVSGAVSFVYEVLWTRLLGHLLGASVYAFATMLASFLLGIALGSAGAARLARTPERAARGFAAAQLGTAVAAYVAFALADRLPDLARGVGAGPGSPLASAVVAAAVLLPMALCIGASFPFAVRLLALRPEHAAAASARVYAGSTLGAIAGSLGAGFVLLPDLGFAGTLAAGVAANLALAALAALGARPRRPRLVLAAAAVAVLLVVAPPRTPWTLLRSSPLVSSLVEGDVAYAAVGRSTTVLLLDQGARWRLVSNGLPESTIDRPEAHPVFYVGRWLGLLPALARPQARDALLVGLGGGLTLGALPSTLERVDVVELEPEIVAANRAISDARGRDPLADPRVRLHLGDARGALRLTDERYDVVVSQPSHPWTAGSSHLYTREFFSLVRARLRPDGVFVQWIGINLVDAGMLRALVATLLDVFPHVEVYQPNPIALLFAASDTTVDAVTGARAALRAAPGDFARYGIHRPEDVAAALVLDDEGARALAKGAMLNTDDHNLLATRASRLGTTALDPSTLRRMLEPHDPLTARRDGLDRSTLIRRLVAGGFFQRAEALADAGDGAAREAGQGWVALGRVRPRTAARHFTRARALDPSDGDALAGLLASRRVALARGEPLPGIAEDELDGPLAAVVAGWRLESRGDWVALSALDADLARLRPGAALFEAAARLRVEWRIAAGAATAAAEALAIADTLAARGGLPEDTLLRARAAAAAGWPEAAWWALDHLADQLASDVHRRDLVERALELASELPETPAAREVRARLVRRTD
jgi:spermidine synthase